MNAPASTSPRPPRSRRTVQPALLAQLIVLLLATAVPTHAGSILREVWEGIGGGSLNELTNSVNFPARPTSTNYVSDLFEAPVDFADNYGQRLHGYVIPPRTGGSTSGWQATTTARSG